MPRKPGRGYTKSKIKGRRKARPSSQVFKPRAKLDASQVIDRRVSSAAKSKGPGKRNLTVAPIVHIRRNLKVAAVPSLRQAIDALGGLGPKGAGRDVAPIGPLSKFSQMMPGILQSTGYLPKPRKKSLTRSVRRRKKV